MEKSINEQKGFGFVLDTRRITDKKMKLTLVAISQEKEELATWYELPLIHQLQVDIQTWCQNNIIHVQGHMMGNIVQHCVVTNEELTEQIDDTFHLLFTTDSSIAGQYQSPDIDMEEDEVEFLPRGQIYFKNILKEQFGLNINPFPRKSTELFEYRESSVEEETKHPFSVLKHLTK